MSYAAKIHPGYLPSDRIAPPPKQGPQPPEPQGKGRQVFLKSKEVRRLEKLKNDLSASRGSERDPSGGCFCQAREHPLSPYTPMCLRCGLTLCSLHAPRYLCPHCFSNLHTPATCDALIDRIGADISDTLRKEEAERERIFEESRKAEGEFPALQGHDTLPSSSSAQGLNAQPVQSYKVLSLTASKVKPKPKKPKGSNRPTPSATPASQSRESLVEEMHVCVSRPPSDVPFSFKESDSSQPWYPLLHTRITYLAPASKVASLSLKKAKNDH